MFEMVGYNVPDPRLKEGEEREPGFGPLPVRLVQSPRIGQCVVVQKESCGDVKGDEDVY